MGGPGGSPEGLLDALFARDPNILVFAGEALQILSKLKDARGPSALVKLHTIEGRLCPALADLISVFENVAVGSACQKLELWRYAHRRRGARGAPR